MPTSTKESHYPHLSLWSRPRDYAGATWEGYYGAGVGQSRDSGALERANFQAMQNALKGCKGWQVVREGHWAVGWVEWIAISPRARKALAIADKLMAGYEDYPCLDEGLYSQIEDEDAAAIWESCFDKSERVAYLREHSYTAESWRDVRAAVNGDWCAAASMLHSPTDILC